MQLLRETYVYPDKVDAIEKEIMSRFDRGEYQGVNNNFEFIRKMNNDLKEVSGDRHLGITPVDPDNPVLSPVMPVKGEPIKHNFSFRKMEILDGNVGYIEFDKFYSNYEAYRVVDDAFGFLRHTDALILDLRHCVGGSPDLVQHMLSYFFKTNTELWTSVDRNGIKNTVTSFDQTRIAHFKGDYPMYIITSSNTTSACEIFTYVLQQSGKAKVIGEKTPGATHAVASAPINQYFNGRFSVLRHTFPYSQSEFEGIGIVPDIAEPLESSIARAHDAALDVLSI